jgi:MYXO-CTERM domain-containing protein
MKRTLIVALVALAVPATAAAKGPSKAEVSGPGIAKTLVITGAERPGTPLMNFAESAGFFPLVFDQSPDPTLRSRPAGTLGRKLSVVYTVPGPNGSVFTIRQELYPYAKPFPLSYMKPGQRIFASPGGTHGGWFVGDPRLKSTLVHAGLAANPPSSSGGSTPWWIAGVAVAGLLLLGAIVVLLRRRPHGRTAPEPT